MARIPLGIETDNPGSYNTKLNNREKKLAEAVREDANIEITGKTQPVVSATTQTGVLLSDAESAAGDEVGMIVDGHHAELHLAVVESTGTSVYAFPYLDASGNLAFPLDANVTDGPTAQEMSFGITSGSKAAYTVGSFLGDKKVYIEANIAVADVTDLDQFFLGFRKAEAYQAEPDNYDELAAWHVGETGATVADGQINIATIINGAATVYTDTTETDWADTKAYRLRMEVSNDGTCKFKITAAAASHAAAATATLAEPTVTKAFTFDSGEVIVPFFFYENTSGSTTGDPGITVSALSCGYM